MSDNLDPVIKNVLGLVQDGLYGRFGRDPILAQAHGRKIKVDLGDGSFLTREYTSQEVAQVPPQQLAASVLNRFANEQKKRDLLGYAREKFPDAASVRLVEDGIYDDAVVGAVVELKFKAARVLAGVDPGAVGPRRVLRRAAPTHGPSALAGDSEQRGESEGAARSAGLARQ